MLRHIVAAAAAAVLLVGGAVYADGHGPHGRPDRANPPRPPVAVRVAAPPAPAPAPAPERPSVPDLKGAVPGVVVSVAPGVLTLQAPAAQLPAHLAAETTGGPQVDAVLPLSSTVQIVTRGHNTPAQLQAGEHVQVVISGGSVTAVVIDGAGGPPAKADHHD